MTKLSPLNVSIVTVCFNSEQTIGQALSSVAEQSWPHVQHIVVDGGSTDGTLDVIKAQGAHVATLISEPDKGIYDAMNKGVAAANGDVIAFLNSDDHYARPDVIEQIAQIMGNERLDALLGDTEFYDPSRPERAVRRYDSSRFRPERIAWGWMPAHPGLFMRRAVYDAAGPFKTDYRIAGDFEFIARVFSKQRLRYRHLDEVLVKMRIGGVSTGGIRSTIRLNREVLRACRQNGIKTNALMILSKYPAKLLEFFR